jgi:hypothetical protein
MWRERGEGAEVRTEQGLGETGFLHERRGSRGGGPVEPGAEGDTERGAGAGSERKATNVPQVFHEEPRQEVTFSFSFSIVSARSVSSSASRRIFS